MNDNEFYYMKLKVDRYDFIEEMVKLLKEDYKESKKGMFFFETKENRQKLMDSLQTVIKWYNEGLV